MIDCKRHYIENGTCDECGLCIDDIDHEQEDVTEIDYHVPNISTMTFFNFENGTRKYSNMALIQKWTNFTSERWLNSVLIQFKNVAADFDLPSDVVIRARILYTNLYRSNQKITVCRNVLARGKNKIGLVAHCFYLACVMCSVGKSVQDVAEMFGTDAETLLCGEKKYNLLAVRDKIPDLQYIQMIQSRHISMYKTCEVFFSSCTEYLDESKIYLTRVMAKRFDSLRIDRDSNFMFQVLRYILRVLFGSEYDDYFGPGIGSDHTVQDWVYLHLLPNVNVLPFQNEFSYSKC